MMKDRTRKKRELSGSCSRCASIAMKKSCPSRLAAWKASAVIIRTVIFTPRRHRNTISFWAALLRGLCGCSSQEGRSGGILFRTVARICQRHRRKDKQVLFDLIDSDFDRLRHTQGMIPTTLKSIAVEMVIRLKLELNDIQYTAPDFVKIQ